MNTPMHILLTEKTLNCTSAVFLHALQWASCAIDDNGEDVDCLERFEPCEHTKHAARQFVETFTRNNLALIVATLEGQSGYTIDSFYTDLALTCAGTGCGFWDGRLKNKTHVDQLTEAARDARLGDKICFWVEGETLHCEGLTA